MNTDDKKKIEAAAKDPRKAEKVAHDEAETAAHRAADVAKDAAGRAAAGAEQLAEKYAGNYKGQAEKGIRDAKEAAGRYTEDLHAHAGEIADTAGHYARVAQEKGSEYLHEAKKRGAHYLKEAKEHPEAVAAPVAIFGGLVTLAAGIAATLLINREQEETYAQQARRWGDDVSHRSRRYAREADEYTHDMSDRVKAWWDRHKHDPADYARRAESAAKWYGGSKLAGWAAKAGEEGGKFVARHPIWTTKAAALAYKARRNARDGYGRARDAGLVLRGGRRSVQEPSSGIGTDLLVGTVMIGLGVAAAYYLRPGSKAGDKVASKARKTFKAVGKQTHGLTDKARGLAHDAASRVGLADDEASSDQQLIARVRSQLGHAVEADLSGLSVEAHDGRVTLSGNVPSQHRDRLVTTARGVSGVTGVEDQLQTA